MKTLKKIVCCLNEINLFSDVIVFSLMMLIAFNVHDDKVLTIAEFCYAGYCVASIANFAHFSALTRNKGK